MTFVDLILLALFGFGCYFAGKVSMAHQIVKEVLEQVEEDVENKQSTLNNGDLVVEKVNGCYYAYVGQAFVGQACTFDELFQVMKQNKRIGTFTIKTANLTTLSREEQLVLAKSFKENFDIK